MGFLHPVKPLLQKPLAILFLLLFKISDAQHRLSRKRHKPLERYRSQHHQSNNRISIQNMTCGFFEQPLNHFELPRRPEANYSQRYCTFDGYVRNMANATVLFYTGNESPLEQYINNTGLMWELAEDLNALVVFVEHRYEGKSRPSPDIPNCMAYSSSVQALADYANFIERKLFSNTSSPTKPLQRRPVIAFGGSYGGMLAAWMRMKYPNLIAGAVAASAPIWGFPRNFPRKIDSAWQVVRHGLSQPYPPTDEPKDDNHCSRNLLAAWPLIQVLADIPEGRELLSRAFRLCRPLTTPEDGKALVDWAQSPWFDLAEGSFPYPSSYIPFALTHDDHAKLPAWPLQAACWMHSDLHEDFGILILGNISDVRYEIHYGEDGTVMVDWDAALVGDGDLRKLVSSDAVIDLLTSVRDAVSVWFNITKDVQCYNLTTAPSMRSASKESFVRSERKLLSYEKNATALCQEKMKEGSWPSLCCNEEMNLIITEASGLGRDMLWPPSHPRGTASYQDIIPGYNWTDSFCSDPGFYGYPTDPPDPWSTRYDIYYGGTSIDSHSNIIFSNGLLDPWSAAGVYAKGMDPTPPNDQSSVVIGEAVVPGLYIQNISDSNMIALIMEYGGHHTDLMYSSKKDPPSIREARKIEGQLVRKWIREWWDRALLS